MYTFLWDHAYDTDESDSLCIDFVVNDRRLSGPRRLLLFTLPLKSLFRVVFFRALFLCTVSRAFLPRSIFFSFQFTEAFHWTSESRYFLAFVCLHAAFFFKWQRGNGSLGLIFRFLFFFFWTDRLAESVSYWGHSRHASLSFAHLCAIPSRFAICDSANRSSFVASRRSQSRLGTGDNDGETRCRRRAVSVPFFLLLNPIHFSFRFELERSFISPSLRRNSSILLSSAAEPVPSWKEKVDVPTMTATPNVCY